MKKMQDFHNRIFSKSKSVTRRVRHMKRLTRLNRDQVISAAAFDPWYWWEAGEPAG